MSQNNPSNTLVVAVSLAVAMALRIVPLPHGLFVYNPDWVLLFLIYWSMALPERVGVGYAWFAGLLTDVLTGRMLGQHALAYAVVAYFCVRLHRRLRLYPLPQQMLSALAFLLLSQLLIFWTQNIRGSNTIGPTYWLPSLTGALFWPPVFLTLRHVRRYFNIF
jgi:rod shape-determining protein MreD